MDQPHKEFITTFTAFLDEVVDKARAGAARTSELGALVSGHLNADASTLPLVTEHVSAHRLVDADIALELLAGPDAQLVGVAGGQARQHEDFPQLLSSGFGTFRIGAVDYVSLASGPDSQRQVVAFGIRLFHFDGEPVAVLQRAPGAQFGREFTSIDVLAANPETTSALLAELKRLMLTHSVLRGKVLSFTGNELSGASGATFLPRPSVAADEVILRDGVRERIVSHVVEIGRLRDKLKDAGQHLKRGVLLYGPPGTGKTLTVRHLLSAADDVTAVLLSGASIRYITEAAELARAMQPAIVVLEDVDLVASERDMFDGPQPLLFAVMDALDGLDGDADVAFVLTTNRADMLESALSQRPGRIDLAVEIPLPGIEERRRLFALYAASLALSPEAIELAADRAEGTTGSFAKELMRRTVLRAAQGDRAVRDDDLSAALDELLSDREELTRSLLGSGGDEFATYVGFAD